MKRVLILVEGQTEEAFVKTILSPHLIELNVFPSVTIIATRRSADRKDFKGGVVNYLKVKTDLRPLLHDSSASLITTIIDFYALPGDFPGMSDCPAGSCYDRVKHVESAFATDINHRKFLPYLSLHEFEALLFSSPQHIDDHFPTQAQLQELEQIKAQCGSPEEIDDQPKTAPSKRLRKIYPEYQKRTDGVAIALKIGLDLMRQECSHFNHWLTKLEGIGSEQS